MFDNISSWLESGWDSVKESASGVSDSWSASVNDLRNKANEFVTVFAKLKKIQANPNLSAAELTKVNAIIKRGETVKSTVGTLTKSIDGIANILPRNLLSGVVKSGNLGILPLIPIAAITAAIAAMTVWLSDAYVEVERLELAEKVRIDGGNPASVLGGGIGGVNWWVIGGVTVGVVGLVYLLGRSGGGK